MLTRHLIGVDNLLWGNDYPHHDAIWPHSMENARQDLRRRPRRRARADVLPQHRRALRHRHLGAPRLTDPRRRGGSGARRDRRRRCRWRSTERGGREPLPAGPRGASAPTMIGCTSRLSSSTSPSSSSAPRSTPPLSTRTVRAPLRASSSSAARDRPGPRRIPVRGATLRPGPASSDRQCDHVGPVAGVAEVGRLADPVGAVDDRSSGPSGAGPGPRAVASVGSWARIGVGSHQRDVLGPRGGELVVPTNARFEPGGRTVEGGGGVGDDRGTPWHPTTLAGISRVRSDSTRGRILTPGYEVF